MVKVIIGILVAAVIVIGGIIFLNSGVVQNDPAVVESENTISYTIEGEVSKQGTYMLDESITMNKLIEAAGGLTENADERCFFNDAELKSGTTYYIAGRYNADDICSNSEISKVNVNSDTADELMAVNGISSSVATSIVSYRTENGAFRTIEDLLKVYGIGNATYRKIRGYVILHA